MIGYWHRSTLANFKLIMCEIAETKCSKQKERDTKDIRVVAKDF